MTIARMEKPCVNRPILMVPSATGIDSRVDTQQFMHILAVVMVTRPRIYSSTPLD